MKRVLSFLFALALLLAFISCNHEQPTQTDQMKFKSGYVYARITGKVGLADGRVIESYDKPIWVEIGPISSQLGKSSEAQAKCLNGIADGVLPNTISSGSELIIYWSAYGDWRCEGNKTWKHFPDVSAKAISPAGYTTLLMIKARVKDAAGPGGGGAMDITSPEYSMYVPYNYCTYASGYMTSAYNHDFNGQADEAWLHIKNVGSATAEICYDGTHHFKTIWIQEQ